MAQKLCNGLWTAGVRERGIATDTLTNFIESNLAWKRNFGRLGVPKQWPEDWDFFAAISACVNDCIYHGLWLVVRRAIKDIGLAEGSGVETPWSAQLLQAHKRIEEESKHAAMRIAALVSESDNRDKRNKTVLSGNRLRSSPRTDTYVSTRSLHITPSTTLVIILLRPAALNVALAWRASSNSPLPFPQCGMSPKRLKLPIWLKPKKNGTDLRRSRLRHTPL